MTQKFRLLTLMLLLSQGTTVIIQASHAGNDSIVYVWDFKPNPQSINDIAVQLTNDFETELINLDQYMVLERRRFNRIVAHRKLENRISDISEVPDSSKRSLQEQQAQVVIFGEVKDDINSGVYEVVVTFQKLNAEILRKESILIGRGLIMDNETRKSKMKELMDKLHSKELNALKMQEFEWVSEVLSSYLVRAKNVQKEFQDMAHAAFEDERYFSQLNKSILDYNEIFDDLHNNGAKYQMKFSEHWKPSQAQSLERIIKDMINNIHKTHMLKLDKVRVAMWDYWQMSSKKRKKVKRDEILKSVSNTASDLQTQIEVTGIEVSNFLNELKQEMTQ